MEGQIASRVRMNALTRDFFRDALSVPGETLPPGTRESESSFHFHQIDHRRGRHVGAILVEGVGDMAAWPSSPCTQTALHDALAPFRDCANSARQVRLLRWCGS